MEPKSERHIRPDIASAGCWVRVWEDTNYNDKCLILWGPAEYASLENLPNAGGEDWNDQFGSLVTGPMCWVQLFYDKSYLGTETWVGPGSWIRDLGDMEDEAESMKIYDYPPTRFFEWTRERDVLTNAEARARKERKKKVTQSLS